MPLRPLGEIGSTARTLAMDDPCRRLVVDAIAFVVQLETVVGVLVIRGRVTQIKPVKFEKHAAGRREQRGRTIVDLPDVVEEGMVWVPVAPAKVRGGPVTEHHAARFLQRSVGKYQLSSDGACVRVVVKGPEQGR